MRNLVCNNPIIIMIVLLISSVIGIQFNVHYMELIGNRLWGLIPVRLILGVIMIGIIYIIAGKEIFKWPEKSGRYAFSCCSYFLLYNGILAILFICTTIKSLNDLNEDWLYLTIIFFLFTLVVGFFEEGLFRGIIVNGLVKVMPKTKKSLYFAIIMSGIIFGLVHIIWEVSIFLEGSLLVVIKMISEVLAIGTVGILFAAVYLKTKNIWVCMIIHAVEDFIPFFTSALVGINEVSQQAVYDTMNPIIIIVNIFWSFLFAIPNLIIAIRVMKKLNPSECIIWK